MKTILVVEDELDLLRTLEAILTGEGYDVVTAGDGEAALRLLRERPPHLLITDVMLPFRSGLALLEAVQHAAVPSSPPLPVVLMSVVPPAARQEEGGWQAFLQKPFTLERLLQVVERLIGKPGKGASPR